jgi:ABC-2 type transport system permease protein
MNPYRSTYLVAWREATERARSRAYIISTVFTLLILGAIIAVVVLTKKGTESYDVGLAGDTPAVLTASIDATATAADVLVDARSFTDAAAARRAVADGTIDAAVIDDDTIVVKSPDGSTIEAILKTALRQARLLTRLDALGVDPGSIADTGAIAVVATDEPKDTSGEGIAVIAVVLLFLVITTYGQWVLMGIIEEKSNHVVEQVVSSTSVRALLAGKTIGIGILGLAQLAVLIVAGLVLGSAFDLFTLPSATYATAAWSVLWFLLGFAFYAVLYAAAASLVSKAEDAQAAVMPIALVSIAAYLLALTVVAPNPDTMLSRIVSLLPPVAPIAFPARIGFGGVATWEILLGAVITAVTVVLVVRLAARVYAGAILAAGGRVKVGQAWRAAKELAGR